jgi:ABC-type nitrate/sulfonate/bicarbonate transport system substrate-binding protein
MKFKQIMLCISFLILLAGCTDEPGTSNENALVMQLNWTDDPTFTGEYIAKERFWFLKKLDVTLMQGGIGIDPIAMILSKKADFAVVGADKAIMAISSGKPIRIVSIDLQRNPVGWIVRRKLKVLNFDDLKGRTDLVLGDKTGTEVSSILKLVLDRKGLDITPKGVSFDFSYFIANENSIYPVYLNEEPIKAEVVHKIPINEIDPSKPENGGIRLYGNVIVTHVDMVNARSNVVKNFVSALSNGWEYAKDKPDESLKIVLKYVKNDKEYVRQVMNRTVDFATNMYGRKVPAGHMEYSAWENTVNTLRESGLLKGDVDLNKAIYLWRK